MLRLTQQYITHCSHHVEIYDAKMYGEKGEVDRKEKVK